MRQFTSVLLVIAMTTVVFFNAVPRLANDDGSSARREPLPLVNDAFMPPDLLEYERTKGNGPEPMLPAPGPLETSEYMMGKVAVAVILPESNGNDGWNTEDWTQPEKDTIKSEVQEGLNWWAGVEPNATLSFVYDWTYVDAPVDSDYEFIKYNSVDHNTIVSHVMGKLGYSSGTAFQRTRDFINALRTAQNTDWGFIIFIADSSADADGLFPDGRVAYAWLGGPFVIMNYKNDGWGSGSMNLVTAHETGHIFWALDEYSSSGCATSDRSGYLNGDTPNCENGGTGDPNIMLDSALTVLSGTRKQIGWQDTDADTAQDILDLPPNTILNPYAPDPTNQTTLVFTGSSTVVALTNLNPGGTSNDVSINKIADVEYRIDGGATLGWTSATPSDGAFNEDIESFTFTTPVLSEGPHTFEARAKLTVPTPSPGPITMYDASPASDSVLIDLGKPTSSVDALATYKLTQTFPVSITASDGAGSGVKNATLNYSKDGGPFQSYGTDNAQPWSFNFDTAGTGGDGTYSFYSVTFDNAGNREDLPIGNDTWTVVDTVKPSSVVSALPTFSPVSFLVTITASDLTSGVQQVELWYRKDFDVAGYALYGSADLTSPWEFNFDTATTGGDGFYEFYSVARDLAGNQENIPGMPPDTSTTIDSQKPGSSVNSLPVLTGAASFPVSVAASDPSGSGVKNVTLRYSKEGGGYLNHSTDAAFPWSFTFDSSATGDGLYEFYSIAYDNAGNLEDAPAGNDTWTLVDTQKPSSSVDALPAFTSTSSFTVDATVLTDPSGIQEVKLWYRKDSAGGFAPYGAPDTSSPWNFTFDSLTTGGDGFYEFYSIATDGIGNVENAPLSADASTQVDTQNPVSSVNALSIYKNMSAFTVNVTVTDPGSGIQKVELWYNRSSTGYVLYDSLFVAPWTFTFDTATTGGDGLYAFYSKAFDNTSNVENVPLVNDTWTLVDTQKPVSNVLATLPQFINSTAVIDMQASDLNGIVSVELWMRKDSGPWTPLSTLSSSPWTFNFNALLTGGEGHYEFYSRAMDSVMLYEDAPLVADETVEVDLTPPEMQFTAPSGSVWLNSSDVLTEWTGLDSGSGLSHYNVSIDGGAWIPKSLGISHTFTGLTEGPHTVGLRATDNVSNFNTSYLSIHLDLSPPVLSITSPSNNTNLSSGSSFIVRWAGSDSSSDIDHYEMRLDNGTFVGVGLAVMYLFNNVADGTHNITIRAVNGAGLTAERSITIKIGGSTPDDGNGGTDDGGGDFLGDLLNDYWSILLLLFMFIIIIVLVLFFALARRRRRRENETAVMEQAPVQRAETAAPAQPEGTMPEPPEDTELPPPPPEEELPPPP